MSKKGSKEERDLVSMFWDVDFAAMRAPASGSATKKPLPDVIAGNGNVYFAIEVKSSSKDKIYINSEKILGLREFSSIFGAKAYVGVKFKRKKWLFVSLDDLEITKGENYKLDKNLALEKGIEFDELIGNEKQMRFL